jgi:hypothetical protein
MVTEVTHGEAGWLWSFFFTKKHEISRTFGLKKSVLLSWPSFG